MVVIYSKQVLSAIAEYTDSLANYPISDDRAREKIDNMFNALQSIASNPFANPVCRYKDLGQTFYRGKPMNLHLRQFVYKDEANRPWTFAYLINEKLQKVIITKMMYSAFIVKENPEVRKILSLMDRMDELN